MKALLSLAFIQAITGTCMPLISDDPKALGKCKCGGNIYETTISKKPRCASCRKLNQFADEARKGGEG